MPEKSGAGAEEVFRQLLRKYNLSQEMLVQKADQGQGADLVKEFIRETGVSGRQVAEMAGMNRERVRRIIVSKEPSPMTQSGLP